MSPDDLDSVRSSDTEFEVVGDPWRGYQDLPSAPTYDDSRREAHGVHAFPDLGQTQEWQTVDWNQPDETVNSGGQVDTSVGPTERANDDVAAPPVSFHRDGEEETKSSTMVHMIVSIVCVALIGTCVGGAIYVMRAVERYEDDAATVDDQGLSDSDDPQQDKAVRWTDATRAAQRKERVIVKVETASYGAVRAKDLNRKVITTDDDNLIALTISIRNRYFEARAFKSWYGHTFEAEGGDVILAELFDDRDRSYQMLKFEDVASLEGQRLADEIEQGGFVRDTLVFVVPEDVDRKKIKHFRLALPAVAVGLKGWYRFQIPVSMISGY
jgi:hypothetical protein